MPQPESSTEHGEEVLDTSRRRRLPRWAVALAWLVAAAAAVTVFAVTRSGGAPRRTAAPSSSGPARPIVQGAPDDVLINGDVVYGLAHGYLSRSTIDGGTAQTDRLVPVRNLDLTLQGATYRLVFDRDAGTLWVVTLGAGPAAIVAFDPVHLDEQRRFTVPNDVAAAAALHGHLYLAAANGVLDIAPGASAPVPVPALADSYFDLVADPARGRLLLFGGPVSSQFSGQVSGYLPGSPAPSPVAPVSPGKGGLAVAAGAVWLGGYGLTGAVLQRLDPATLHPVRDSPLAAQIGPGALLVATGDRVLWVRSGGGGDGLWCVDAATGAVLQQFQFDGPVASRHGVAFRLGADGLARLQLSGCPG